MRFLESIRIRRPQILRRPRSRPSSAPPAAIPSHQSDPATTQTGPNNSASTSSLPPNREEPGVNGEGLLPGSREDSAVSLWDRAYDALRESDRQLVGRYEELLSRELQTTGSRARFSDAAEEMSLPFFPTPHFVIGLLSFSWMVKLISSTTHLLVVAPYNALAAANLSRIRRRSDF